MIKRIALILSVFAFCVNINAKESKLEFSHSFHIEEAEVTCIQCHAKADKSITQKENLIPTLTACTECHDEADGFCEPCNKTPDNSITKTSKVHIYKFPHAKHIANGKTCKKCHVKKGAEELAIIMPTMSSCTECHNETIKKNYCTTCHAKSEDLRPNDHKLDFVKHHGIASNVENSNCAECHHSDNCTECHTKTNLTNSAHPLNYLNNHGLQARGNKNECKTCHNDLSDCAECHRTRMVMPRSHAAAGWSNRSTGGAHNRAATVDIDGCISCHPGTGTTPVCAECHSR